MGCFHLREKVLLFLQISLNNMGFFFSSPEEKYSNVRHTINDEHLRMIVSRAHAGGTLSQDEEVVIESALRTKKFEHDSRLSLRDIYLVLHELRRSHSISEYDEKGVMKELVEYFSKF